MFSIFSSQKANDLTGEHSIIMISILKSERFESSDWLSMYFRDFRRRLIKLLAKAFQSFTTGLALSLLDNKAATIKNDRKYDADKLLFPHDICFSAELF